MTAPRTIAIARDSEEASDILFFNRGTPNRCPIRPFLNLLKLTGDPVLLLIKSDVE